jgi:hypothetical protein
VGLISFNNNKEVVKMKYIEAYESMKEGNHLSRAAWDYVTAEGHADEKFCMMLKDAAFILCVRYFPNLGWTQYMPLVEDLEADDWYVKNTNWSQPTAVTSENLVAEALPVDATVM